MIELKRKILFLTIQSSNTFIAVCGGDMLQPTLLL